MLKSLALRLVPALALAVAVARAQCPLLSQPGLGYLGTDGDVVAVTWWDPDGVGPLAARAVFGGDFTIVGSTPCRSLVAMDRTTGHLTTFAAGMVDRVHDLASGPAGELFVAGSRTTGAVTTHVVARWQNGAWTQLGTFDAPVLVLSRAPNSGLFAGGEFQQVGALAAARIARWDGAAWHALGAGVVGGALPRVATIAHATNADVLAGGQFAQAGAVAAANIARWDGATWSAMASGIPQSVTSIAVLQFGEIVATGPGVTEPRVWQANTWQAVSGLLPPTAGAQVVTHVLPASFPTLPAPPSRLFAFGRFSLPQLPDQDLALVDASSSGTAMETYYVQWRPGVALPRVDAETDPATGLIALAGDVVGVVGMPCDGAALLQWATPGVGNGIGGDVNVVGAMPDGAPLFGGTFVSIGDRPLQALARFEGIEWRELGGGLGSPGLLGGTVNALAVASDGGVVAGGEFVTLSWPVIEWGVARFDGVAWAPLGNGLQANGAVHALLARGSEVFAGTDVGLARWDGSIWSMLTGVAAGISGPVMTLAALPNGDIVAGGSLQVTAGGAAPGVMRWNGSTWSPLGAGLGSAVPGTAFTVLASCVRANGDLFVVGFTTSSAFCARWNGATWSALPAPASGDLLSIAALPNGDVVVGGEFGTIGGVQAMSVARWNGAVWSAIGSGVQHDDGAPGRVRSLALSPLGELLIGGDFERVDGELAVKFGRLRPACPATAAPFGAGCAGAALAATALPWLGATARSVATGMPANGLAVVVRGFGTAFVPLAAVLPAAPACTLWTTPDLLAVALPSAGSVTLDLAIPATTSLVGTVLHEQVVAIELGAGGALTGASSTNRLSLTIGSL